jgi:hypothetical protein
VSERIYQGTFKKSLESGLVRKKSNYTAVTFLTSKGGPEEFYKFIISLSGHQRAVPAGLAAPRSAPTGLGLTLPDSIASLRGVVKSPNFSDNTFEFNGINTQLYESAVALRIIEPMLIQITSDILIKEAARAHIHLTTTAVATADFDSSRAALKVVGNINATAAQGIANSLVNTGTPILIAPILMSQGVVRFQRAPQMIGATNHLWTMVLVLGFLVPGFCFSDVDIIFSQFNNLFGTSLDISQLMATGYGQFAPRTGSYQSAVRMELLPANLGAVDGLSQTELLKRILSWPSPQDENIQVGGINVVYTNYYRINAQQIDYKIACFKKFISQTVTNAPFINLLSKLASFSAKLEAANRTFFSGLGPTFGAIVPGFQSGTDQRPHSFISINPSFLNTYAVVTYNVFNSLSFDPIALSLKRRQIVLDTYHAALSLHFYTIAYLYYAYVDYLGPFSPFPQHKRPGLTSTFILIKLLESVDLGFGSIKPTPSQVAIYAERISVGADPFLNLILSLYQPLELINGHPFNIQPADPFVGPPPFNAIPRRNIVPPAIYRDLPLYSGVDPLADPYRLLFSYGSDGGINEFGSFNSFLPGIPSHSAENDYFRTPVELYERIWSDPLAFLYTRVARSPTIAATPLLWLFFRLYATWSSRRALSMISVIGEPAKFPTIPLPLSFSFSELNLQKSVPAVKTEVAYSFIGNVPIPESLIPGNVETFSDVITKTSTPAYAHGIFYIDKSGNPIRYGSVSFEPYRLIPHAENFHVVHITAVSKIALSLRDYSPAPAFEETLVNITPFVRNVHDTSYLTYITDQNSPGFHTSSNPPIAIPALAANRYTANAISYSTASRSLFGATITYHYTLPFQNLDHLDLINRAVIPVGTPTNERRVSAIYYYDPVLRTMRPLSLSLYLSVIMNLTTTVPSKFAFSINGNPIDFPLIQDPYLGYIVGVPSSILNTLSLAAVGYNLEVFKTSVPPLSGTLLSTVSINEPDNKVSMSSIHQPSLSFMPDEVIDSITNAHPYLNLVLTPFLLKRDYLNPDARRVLPKFTLFNSKIYDFAAFKSHPSTPALPVSKTDPVPTPEVFSEDLPSIDIDTSSDLI